MGGVRFASDTVVPQDSDISCWPGVYVHPGKFKSPTASVDENGEVWVRYRNRYRRLQALHRLPKAERRKREREFLVISNGHCRFCRRSRQ